LAADGDALLTENSGDTGLGDAIDVANLLSGFASFVAVHDIGNILGGQEALRARVSLILGR